MKKEIILPVIPRWLASQIEIDKIYQKEMNKVTNISNDFILNELIRANQAIPDDWEYPNANGKYIAEHMIDVAVAIKYGYEVEDE